MATKKSSKPKKKKKESFIGKVGFVFFDTIRIQVKVIEEKSLAGRTHVLVKPTATNGSGQVWKYVANIDFGK